MFISGAFESVSLPARLSPPYNANIENDNDLKSTQTMYFHDPNSIFLKIVCKKESYGDGVSKFYFQKSVGNTSYQYFQLE